MKNRQRMLSQQALVVLRRLWDSRQQADVRSRRQAFLLESLEPRTLMAGDLSSNLTGSVSDLQPLFASNLYSDSAYVSAPAATPTSVADYQSEGEASEGEAANDLVAFAKALSASGAKFYGAYWSPQSTATKQLFEDGAQYLPYVEVTDADRDPLPVATQNNITTYPTWVFNAGTANETRLEGEHTLAEISAAAGIAIPTGSTPSIAPIEDQTILTGAPTWVGLDGYDPNSSTLTYTVTSDNPSVVTATVPSGNRSMTIDVAGFGKMTFELFDNLAPRVTNAIASLVESGAYNKTATHSVTFHRVLEDFVNQAGILANAAPTFQDQFSFDAQHTSKGLLSLAKTDDDDSGTSQFFITAEPTRHLDFNHPVFGRLIEGQAVSDAINKVATTASGVPLDNVVINSITINANDTENGLLLLKAVGNQTGTANITVRATDGEGQFVEETFQVSVQADTANTPAFLDDIAPVSTIAGQAVQFTLHGNDVEGNTLVYGATLAETGTPAGATVSVNASTGVVTVTPPVGYVGKIQVLVSVDDPASNVGAASKRDSQLVSVDVVATAPALVNLTSDTDSGSSSSDNVTNAPSMKFDVTGVTAGSIVKLYNGNTMIGQATVATGATSVTIETSAVAGAGEGVHLITATQTVGGIESNRSTATSVTFDITPPAAFTSTPPTTATPNQAFVYDAANPEENTAGFRYQLQTATPNVSIDAATGVINWTPSVAQANTTVSFVVQAVDAAGNVQNQVVSAAVGEVVVPKAEITLKVTNAQGVELQTLTSGQEFFLRIFVHDNRPVVNATGVFAAYTDIIYDATKVSVNGALVYGSFFSGGRTGNTTTAGLIDELGAFGGLTPYSNPSSPIELVAIPMKALASGGVTFATSAADLLPAHDILLYDDNNQPVAQSLVSYGAANATVDLSFGASDDSFTTNEDSSAVIFDPLANDIVGTNTLTISAVGAGDHGGTLTIAADGKTVLYTPAANFFGTESFSYTVKNQDNLTDTGTIAILVQNTNDPPVGVADAVSVNEDAVDFPINVLANDLFTPDPQETLRVTAVSAGSAGGTIKIAAGNGQILYTPASNFTGVETFTYTVSDGNGGSAQATVTVSVNAGNDNPTAVADTVTFVEDSSNNVISPLTNDSAGPDTGETITILSVGTTNKGGTVTISQDKTKLNYTPAANFQGLETFTYTISDGNGGTATATITVNVTNTNDAPTATTDTVTTFKNTPLTIDALANDLTAPDPAETLTITSVTTPQHGVATIVNGKILYTPTTGYSGSDTFTYTITDTGGLTSTATVNLSVLEFIPSDLSGYVYVDANRNGIFDSNEQPLAGLAVTLSGSTTAGSAVTKSAVTGADGKYSFTDLAPGIYKVKSTTAAFMTDGAESVGSAGGSVSANDEFTINLAQDTDATNYNFGENGRVAATLSIRDLFASRLRGSLIVAVDSSGGTQFTLTSGAWKGFSGAKATVTTANGVSTLKLDVINPQSVQQSATVSLPDSRVLQLGSSGTVKLYQILGTPESFGFTGGTTYSTTSTFASLMLDANRAAASEGESTDAAFADSADSEDWLTDDAGASDDSAQTSAVDMLLAAQSNW